MDPVEVGETVDDCEGTLVHPDGSEEKIRLSSLTADRPVLLSFYTVDFSPDCITEWCSFRDFGWFTGNPDLQVIGSSKSGPAIHRRFIDYLDLPFPLIADGGLTLADGFGVAYRAFGVSRRSARSCFLVDEDLKVRYRWVGDHWLDPTRSIPPVSEIHEGIKGVIEPNTVEFSAGGASMG